MHSHRVPHRLSQYEADDLLLMSASLFKPCQIYIKRRAVRHGAATGRAPGSQATLRVPRKNTAAASPWSGKASSSIGANQVPSSASLLAPRPAPFNRFPRTGYAYAVVITVAIILFSLRAARMTLCRGSTRFGSTVSRRALLRPCAAF